jgi:hypothetical protein
MLFFYTFLKLNNAVILESERYEKNIKRKRESLYDSQIKIVRARERNYSLLHTKTIYHSFFFFQLRLYYFVWFLFILLFFIINKYFKLKEANRFLFFILSNSIKLLNACLTFKFKYQPN